MRINFVTLFPDAYAVFSNHSIVKRAIAQQLIDVNVVDWRNFAKLPHRKVDDVSYGGGEGMVLMVEPLRDALATLGGYKILLSPQGKTFNQTIAKALAQREEITLIAGHYEGFDERILNYVDVEMSIGDFVLMSGEWPAMIIADAVTRLVPGVIKLASHQAESFENNLLDYPHYTKPREVDGKSVPEVLLNGDHAAIAKWRKQAQIKLTKQKRPDLWARSNDEK